jgi:hypothetical protein
MTFCAPTIAGPLLIVSSCKNVQKYFAIKYFISLFRAVIMEATIQITRNESTFGLKAIRVVVASTFTTTTITG